MYVNERVRRYISDKGKTITVPVGYVSDGATGAFDIESDSWWIHDYITDMDCPAYDDGTPIGLIEEGRILSNILLTEGRVIRAQTWFFATVLYRGVRKMLTKV